MEFTLVYMGKGFSLADIETCTYLEMKCWYDKLIKVKEAEAKANSPANMLEQ